jgi:SAM-dependent methyltransferase
VPDLRFRKTLAVAQGIKVFLNLGVAVTRGEVPDPYRRLEVQDRQLEAQAKQLEQIRNMLLAKDLEGALWKAGQRLAAWEAGKAPEVTFWREWLATKGGDWPYEYEPRLDPEQPLQDRVIKHLNAPPGATVSILDVGAGPLTKLGKRWEGRTVRITAVDPLADEYKLLLDEANITPPVQTQPGEVERLAERFPTNHFDLVNVQNALDHTYDPLLGIRQMLEVVKPGGYILLLHEVNEAHRTGYVGFHQWNFCADNGRFVIWNRETRISGNDALGDKVEIMVDDDEEEQGYEETIFVTLRKR